MLVPSQGIVSHSVIVHVYMTDIPLLVATLQRTVSLQLLAAFPHRANHTRGLSWIPALAEPNKSGSFPLTAQLKNHNFIPLTQESTWVRNKEPRVKWKHLGTPFFVGTTAIPWFPIIAYFLLSRDIPLLLPRPPPRSVRESRQQVDKRHVLVRLLPFLPASGSSSCFASYPFLSLPPPSVLICDPPDRWRPAGRRL